MANSVDPGQKPTDLDLHCLQRQDISGFSRTRVRIQENIESCKYDKKKMGVIASVCHWGARNRDQKGVWIIVLYSDNEGPDQTVQKHC